MKTSLVSSPFISLILFCDFACSVLHRLEFSLRWLGYSIGLMWFNRDSGVRVISGVRLIGAVIVGPIRGIIDGGNGSSIGRWS